jgi:hypothetical protein
LLFLQCGKSADLWNDDSAFLLQSSEQKTTTEQSEQGKTRRAAERQAQQWLLANAGSSQVTDG